VWESTQLLGEGIPVNSGIGSKNKVCKVFHLFASLDVAELPTLGAVDNTQW